MSFLTKSQKDSFQKNGYLVVQDIFDSENIIDPIIDEYAIVLDNLAHKLLGDGVISSVYSDLEFGDRVTKIYSDSQATYSQYFDFSLPQNGIEADTPFWAGTAVFRALTAKGILDIAESIVGEEVYSNPVQHVRVKTPESISPRNEKGNLINDVAITPWHQDSGVINTEADNTNLLTVWFPLMDANVENGCLQVIPGSHKGDILTHCPQDSGTQIPEKLFNSNEAIPVPIKKGDALLLTKKTVHSSLPNISNRIRWSFDLRYQPTGQATGRNVFPGFIARSKSNPSSELHDPKIWYQMWENTRDSLAVGEQPKFNRWDSSHPVCA